MRRRGRRAGEQRFRKAPRVKMTSMMDILVVLLLFLLKSFVVDGEITTPPPDVELPTSSAETPPETSLVVAISDEMILLGGEPVVPVRTVLESDELLIEALDAELDRALGQMDELAERKGSTELSRRITIQGDRDLEFRLLQKVMYTCGESGLSEMALAVVREPRS